MDISENWKIGFTGAYKYFPLGDDKGFFAATFEQRYSLSQNLDVRLEYRLADESNEGVLGVNLYF